MESLYEITSGKEIIVTPCRHILGALEIVKDALIDCFEAYRSKQLIALKGAF